MSDTKIDPKVEKIARLLSKEDGRDPDDCSVWVSEHSFLGKTKRRAASAPYWHAKIEIAEKVIKAIGK